MKSIFLAMLSIFLTTYCSSSESQSKIPFDVPEPTIEEKCDFSAYKPVTVSHFLQTSLQTKVKPTYPNEAKRQGIQGKISVKILVDRNGNVVKACAINGDEILQEAAEESALKWKFKERGIAGQHVSFVEAGIAFNFILEKGSSDEVETIYQ